MKVKKLLKLLKKLDPNLEVKFDPDGSGFLVDIESVYDGEYEEDDNGHHQEIIHYPEDDEEDSENFLNYKPVVVIYPL